MTDLRDDRMYRPKGRPTTTLDQGRILAAMEDVHLLAPLGLDTLESAMAFDKGVIVRDAGPRKTYRVETEEGILFVKIHRDVPLARRWNVLGKGSSSPAHIEWDAISMMRKTGFDVPEPVAFGEEINLLGCPRRSFIITREVVGKQLDHLLEDGYPNPQNRSEREASDQVLRDVAGMVRRFHSTGFYHKDLYCCHLIVTEDPRWGRPFFIDLERVDRDFPPRRRWLVKDLAALHYSAPATVTKADRLRFLLQYMSKRRVDAHTKRCVRDIVEKARKIAAHVPKFG
ncbi:MAG: lipopolysaccharide kinase InaA family protein [Planctomycetota bacterium]